jgi:pimeloyl-ACP methyl ester carboxylesterase
LRASARLLLALSLGAALLASCGAPPARTAPDGVTLTPLRTIPTLESSVLLRAAGVKDVPVRYAVDCYRMSYPATTADGRTERLTGLIAFPRGVAPTRLVSFQHGTETERDSVPSHPDQGGLAAAVVFAGNGYLLLAPDYPGLGGSPGSHPYYVQDETAGSVTAMIAAAERLTGAPKAPPFLVGFSQGGSVTFATLAALEARGRPVLGSAQVAGAYDLSGLSLPTALKGGSPSDSLYLSYLAWGYAHHYGHPLDSVLTPAWAAAVERIYSHNTEPETIFKTLPTDPKAMFRPEVLAAIARRGGHWFAEAVAANDLTGVSPHAPVRLYYGSRDTDVTPQESITEAQMIRARGGDAQAIDVGPLEHNPSMLAAAPRIVAWLQALERRPVR